tara:strand:+ start:142 stop:537 length:396 start_codon:yes stop_codon:yes gene_type:complete
LSEKPSHTGMRHVAIRCQNLEETVKFYTDIIGMKIEWQPDPDNYYLTSGNDNLALHRIKEQTPSDIDRLDHVGFFVDHPNEIDKWYDHLIACGVTLLQSPKTHRDGAKSLYCEDPDGTVIQILYHPPISNM